MCQASPKCLKMREENHPSASRSYSLIRSLKSSRYMEILFPFAPLTVSISASVCMCVCYKKSFKKQARRSSVQIGLILELSSFHVNRFPFSNKVVNAVYLVTLECVNNITFVKRAFK